MLLRKDFSTQVFYLRKIFKIDFLSKKQAITPKIILYTLK